MSEPIVTTVYEPGDDPDDLALVGEVNRILWTHYPGYDWGVEIPPDQNVLYIRNLTLDPTGKVGMVTHLDKISPSRREIVMAGGALLERYNARRGRHDPAETEGKLMHTERADGDPRIKQKRPMGW